jgi:hypothetical protein
MPGERTGSTDRKREIVMKKLALILAITVISGASPLGASSAADKKAKAIPLAPSLYEFNHSANGG